MARSATSCAAAPLRAIERAGATWERIAVPGALEIPGAIAMAHETGLYHGYVALGCVLRGETTHYDIVANESARGIMNLTLEGLCIGNGILTCENEAQAWARAKRRRDGQGRRCGRSGAGHDPAGAQLMGRKEADSGQAKGQGQVTDKRRQKPIARSAARLGAVQALYQMDLVGHRCRRDAGAILVPRHRRDFDDGQCGEADYRHLKDVVDGVVREQNDHRSVGRPHPRQGLAAAPSRRDRARHPARRRL